MKWFPFTCRRQIRHCFKLQFPNAGLSKWLLGPYTYVCRYVFSFYLNASKINCLHSYVHIYTCFRYPPNITIDHKTYICTVCMYEYLNAYTYVCMVCRHMHTFTLCRHLPVHNIYIQYIYICMYFIMFVCMYI